MQTIRETHALILHIKRNVGMQQPGPGAAPPASSVPWKACALVVKLVTSMRSLCSASYLQKAACKAGAYGPVCSHS